MKNNLLDMKSISTLEQLDTILRNNDISNDLIENYCIDLMSKENINDIKLGDAVSVIKKHRASFVSDVNKKFWSFIRVNSINVNDILSQGMELNKNNDILSFLLIDYMLQKNLCSIDEKEVARLEKEITFASNLFEKKFGYKIFKQQIENFIKISISATHFIETEKLIFINDICNAMIKSEDKKDYFNLLSLKANFTINKEGGFFDIHKSRHKITIIDMPVFETLLQPQTDFIINHCPQLIDELYTIYTLDNTYNEYIDKAVLKSNLESSLKEKINRSRLQKV